MATQLPPGMVARIKNILLQPKLEWDRIDAEPMTEKGIFMGWAVPLAAIGPVASFIGGQVFGYGAFGIRFKPPLIAALVSAVIGYVLALVGVWVLAKIIDALAPTFNGTKNPVAATKVAVYSMTASWLAGIFGIIPALAMLGIVGLYSFYLLYLGLPKLMRSPPDKAVGYTVVTVLCGIVLYIVIGAIVAAAATMFAAPMMMGGGTVTGSMTVPGVGTVDMGKLDAASKQMEASAASIQAAAATGSTATANGAVAAVDPGALAAMLPTSAAGWNRTTIESSGANAGGIGGSKADGSYTLGSDSASLSVTDMAAMGALASLGGALNIQSSKQTATGYEKTATVDGRMTTEEWDGSARHGKFSTIVANRFVVEAEGQAATMDSLKALAASVDMGKLAGLAK